MADLPLATLELNIQDLSLRPNHSASLRERYVTVFISPSVSKASANAGKERTFIYICCFAVSRLFLHSAMKKRESSSHLHSEQATNAMCDTSDSEGQRTGSKLPVRRRVCLLTLI